MNTNTRVFTLLVLFLLISGCGDETSSGKSAADGSSKMLPDEITTLNELPSMLQEGLTSEEKADLLKKIMPMAEDGLTPDERFLKLIDVIPDQLRTYLHTILRIDNHHARIGYTHG